MKIVEWSIPMAPDQSNPELSFLLGKNVNDIPLSGPISSPEDISLEKKGTVVFQATQLQFVIAFCL